MQARARAFAETFLLPYEVEAELHDGLLDPAVVASQADAARAAGIWSYNMPTDAGGPGLTHLQQVLVTEQLGRVTNALAWVVPTPASWWVGHATPYQLETWLLPAVRGERRECYAITEEGAGSDVSAIRATATLGQEGYRLDGVKWHVTSANLADHCFFQARLTTGPHAGEQALFVVDLDSPGVRTLRTPAYSHTFAHHHPILAFEDVVVPPENRVGPEGEGMAFAQAWFRHERLMIAARCCGAAQRLLEEVEGFTTERELFGGRLRDLQAVQCMLADSAVELWASRLMTYEAARAHDAGVDPKLAHGLCSMVKLYASEMAGRVADRAVQLFGGRGYMRENVAERFYRELRVERIWEGASEVQRVIVADQLAKRGPRNLIGG